MSKDQRVGLSAIPEWARGSMPPPWEGECPEITEHDWRSVIAAYGPEPADAGPEEKAWRMRKARVNAMLREEKLKSKETN
jgi:hypothetical protein